MSMLNVKSHYELPGSFPTAALVLLLVVGVAAWIASHYLLKRRLRARWLAWAGFVVRVAIGFCVILVLTQIGMRGLVLRTNWAMWLLALLGAVCVEAMVSLYSMERRIVSRKVGLALVGIRTLLILLLICMLTQPVYSLNLTEELRRVIAIVIDDSGSMHVADPQMGDAERARLGQILPDEAAQRPHRLDELTLRLTRSQGVLLSQHDAIAPLKDIGNAADRQKQLAEMRRALHEAIGAEKKKIEAMIEALSKPLAGGVADQATSAELSAAKSRLTTQVRDRLSEAETLTSSDESGRLGERYDKLLSLLRESAKDLGRVAEQARSVGEGLDASFYAQLAPEVKAKVDALAEQTRFNIARHVLLRETNSPDGGKASLLDRLRSKGFLVQGLSFARDMEEIDLNAWEQEYKGIDSPESWGDVKAPRRQQSNGGEALMKVAAGVVQGGKLGGVVFLTDGQLTDANAAIAAGRQLGAAGAPIEAVVVGCSQPPRDAAILNVDAPNSVYLKDKADFRIDVKLDGLAGERGRVIVQRLEREDDGGEKAVGKPIKEEFRVPDGLDSYEMTVTLTDKDTDEVGLYNYRVEVGALSGEAFEREVFATNNAYPVSVSITDDRTKLLLVEGRPRWEFRYLKNLLSDRDRTVQLQYVLLEPDQVEGVKERRIVAASASRPYGDVEATTLPGHTLATKDKEEDFIKEWLKFDVIILGDVSPKMLGERDIEAIRRFVAKRGGTLIVVAGPRHMPHAFADTPLADLVPATFKTSAERAARGPKELEELAKRRRRGYRLMLTDEGERHVVMRQLDDAQDNLRLWDSVPQIYWRCDIDDVKLGAVVLAYALPPDAPEFLKQEGDAVDEDTLRKREDFERKNALISFQPFDNGRVMFLSFDRTWRLRYRVGDTYHHKFWGQVLRWATGEKLPTGTRLVRMGTDRTRYGAEDSVKVEAKVLDQNLNPLGPAESETVAVRVYRMDREAPGKAPEKELILEHKLRAVPGSLGRYEADLGMIGAEHGEGIYAVELYSPVVKRILDEEKKADTVMTHFRVDEAVSTEQKQLASDPTALEMLSRRSGGRMFYPQQADGLAEVFGEGVAKTPPDVRESSLWDTWPVLILILALATVEWVVRKRAGLA
jgi:hypothetical protein